MIQSAGANPQPGTIAPVSAGPAQTGTKPKNARKSRGGRKSEGRPSQKPCHCHHSGQPGHYSDGCPTRTAERARGVFRATIYCPETYYADWQKMTSNEKGGGGILKNANRSLC